MKPFKQRSWIYVGAIAGVLGLTVHAGPPYLPLIGPPPMRLLPAKATPATPVVSYEAAMAQKSKENPAATLPTSIATNNVPAAQNGADGIIYTTSSSPLSAPGTENATAGGVGAPIFNLPPQDFLGITPQALAGYFRPVHPGKPGPGPGINPLYIGFTPPIETQNQPVRPSRATYTIK
jgi:hypothetical protein